MHVKGYGLEISDAISEFLHEMLHQLDCRVACLFLFKNNLKNC